MKIAIHSPRVSYYYGGAERYILNMSLALQKINKDISLITYNAPKKTKWFKEFQQKFKGKIVLLDSNEINQKFNLFRYANKSSLWDLESKLFSKASKDYYKNNKFDLISIHYTTDCFGISKKSKVCLHLHGVPKKIRKKDSQALEIPFKIIAVSKYVLNKWSNAINKRGGVSVILNGINILKIKQLKKNNDIIFFGRLIKIKGVDILIKSIKEIHNHFKNIKIIIVGEGPEKNNLEKLARKLGLYKNIRFFGHVEDVKLHNLIKKSKICVFPSYAREGVMTTLLEAALFKSTILASDSCSNREFIRNKYNGIFFKPKNIKNLSKKIELLLSNQKLRNNLAKNCRKTVEKWTWKNQAKKIFNVYKK